MNSPLDSFQTNNRYSAETGLPGEMDYHLRSMAPMTLGGLFDDAYILYKKHFLTLALVVAIIYLPIQIILHACVNIWLNPLGTYLSIDKKALDDPILALVNGGAYCLTGIPSSGYPGIISLLTSYILTGPIAIAIGNLTLGKPITISTSYRSFIGLSGKLILNWILMVFLGSIIFWTVSMFLLIPSTLTPFSMLFLPISLTLAIVLTFAPLTYWFALVPPIIALENVSLFKAMSRNSALVKNSNFRRCWFATLFVPSITYGLQILMLFSVTSFINALNIDSWLRFLLSSLLISLVSFIFQPYAMIFTTLLYFDVRIRTECLDIRFLVDQLPSMEEYVKSQHQPTAPENPVPMQNHPGATPR